MKAKYFLLIIICFIPTGSSFIYAKNNLDDSEALMESAKGLSSSLNASITVTESELEAIRKKVATKINDLCSLSSSINDLILEIKAIDKRSDKRTLYLSKIAELRAKQTKLAEENKAIDEGMREAGEKAQIAMDLAMASLVIGVIAGNIQIASSAIAFVEQDNRSGLANLLKRDSVSAPVEILETSKLNGITFKMRIGKFAYCLSTKSLCNGLKYSTTK